jgi:flagellin-like hook-associated protein FlgL
MSATIAPYGIMAQLVADTAQVHSSLDTLTEQASSGLVAQTYAGLGATAASTSLNLSPDIAHLQTWQTAINSATGPMDVTQTALTQISAIASTFYADLNNIGTVNVSETDSVAADAQQALQQVAGLLNSQYDGNYVFAGTDTANMPVPSGAAITQSSFFTQIQSAVAGLTGSNADTTFQTILGIGASNDAGTSPFSTSLSQPAATVNAQLPSVQTGEDQSQTIGIAASANAFVASQGSQTTGSYMRDIMTSLATIAAMSSTQATNGSDLTDLVQDTRTCLSGAITALNQDAGVLGDTQSGLQTLQTNLADTQTTLKGQVSDVQNVDMATTLSALTQVQTQLQASYQVISAVGSLSLSKYLSTS